MTKYSETISDLFDLQKFSIKMGLENISTLCNSLGNPQDTYPTIHVAGTNGKGSTSVMIQEILAAHGMKVGVYTSPHLIDFRERIRVNNKLVGKNFIIDFWNRWRSEIHRLKATFFDATTAMAFEYFRHCHVDLAVIETGLGGRLDSTNIIKPVAVVLTPIAVDHTKQLGRDLKSITHEKAILIKKGTTLFSARQKKPVKEIIENFLPLAGKYYYLSGSVSVKLISQAKTHSVFNCFDSIRQLAIRDIRLNLAGKFQVFNSCLAYLTARWYLDHIMMPFTETKFREALANIQWNGRLHCIAVQPDIYLDVSHNYSGFKHTMEFIRQISDLHTRCLLIGLLDDKEYKSIVRLLQKYFERIVITKPNHDRALSPLILKKEFAKYARKSLIKSQIEDAYKFSLSKLEENDQLFIMGSHFIIGEILKTISKKHLTQ
jgi:dihydrofolate synthase/folylpolyglutamate synthase